MVARVTKEASTTSGGISVPLRPMMGVKISNTTQMRNMKCTYGNARPSRYSTQYFADAPGEKKKSLSGITEPERHTHTHTHWILVAAPKSILKRKAFIQSSKFNI